MISIKNWEMKAGKTIFAKMRFKFDIFVAKYLIILKSYTQTKNGRYFLKKNNSLYSLLYQSYCFKLRAVR